MWGFAGIVDFNSVYEPITLRLLGLRGVGQISAPSSQEP